MESCDSSPHYMKSTSSSDAKKENSSGGSEFGDSLSISSSARSIFASKQKVGRKNLINLGKVRSFRRRTRSGVLQPIKMFDSTTSSKLDALVNQSAVASHSLKERSFSKAKKVCSQTCPQCSLCLVDGRDGLNSLPSSSGLGMKNRLPLTTLSRTSRNKNLKILIRRTSFKLKKYAPSRSRFSEDVLVDRATYSSTIKDSKYYENVELHAEAPECGRNSCEKICRYHHCSLHGNCRRDHNPVTQPNRSLYRNKTSVRKQKPVISKNDECRVTRCAADKSLCLPPIISSTESSVRMIKTGSEVLSDVKCLLVSEKPNSDPSVYEYSGVQEFDLLEIAFGETSFPERSYQENLNIMRKYSPEEEEWASFGLKDNCLSSCNSSKQIFSTQREVDADPSQHQISASGLGNEFRKISRIVETDNFNHKFREIPLDEETVNFDCSTLGKGFRKIPQSVEADDLDTFPLTFSEKNPEQLINSMIDHATFNEISNKNSPPDVVNEITKDISVPLSISDRQSSSDSSSEVGGEITFESIDSGNSNSSPMIQAMDSEIGVPSHERKELQFSKPRHISMWRLIHQHMASELATEAANNPLQTAEGESQNDVSKSLPAEERKLSETQHPEFLRSSPQEFSDPNVEDRNSPETREIEVRKVLAIKLVREAIEKILLPEIQDDQSVTTESIHHQELHEKKETEVSMEESSEESVADKLEGNFSSKSEDVTIVDDASNSEMVKVEKIATKPEKKAPKHWSNLKKWILLQRFIKELEKVRVFNPRKPQILAVDPDTEAEKVNLKPQTVDERKKGEEWMLDYALRQAVNQLGPTQKIKVSLLVKAFETVAPTQEDSPVPVRISRFSDNTTFSLSTSGGHAREKLNVDPKSSRSIDFQVSKFESENETNLARSTRKTWTVLGSNESSIISSTAETEESERGAVKLSSTTQMMTSKISTLPNTSSFKLENKSFNLQSDRKNHVEMWHMIYQHVLSGIANKFGNQLLNGSDDNDNDDSEEKFSQEGATFHDLTESNGDLFGSPRSGFTKIDAFKLVKEAVDEILVTSESLTDQEISEKSPGEQNKPKPKNWLKLKKLLFLKKSIKVLEEAREVKRQSCGLAIETPDTEPERVDSRRQLMDEKEKAKNWMLDYAVQHIVGRLTPARKRRVSMLVEAFEAVVPFPET